jgi:hypothetical protein
MFGGAELDIAVRAFLDAYTQREFDDEGKELKF